MPSVAIVAELTDKKVEEQAALRSRLAARWFDGIRGGLKAPK